MKILSNCIVCNSANLRVLSDYSKVYLCKCEDCGLLFSQRSPSKEELEKHYNGYHRNDYLSSVTIKRYNDLLDQFEKFRKTNKIIDIGCGIGYFLTEAKKRGWEVYGTEYTDRAVEICAEKEINIQKGNLNPNNYLPGTFDVVTSFEVIEHINNPQKELKNFNSILREGGLVYITTPNYNSLLRYKLKAKYNIFVYPDHLTYYTPQTLKKLFSMNGFTPIKLEATGISLTRLRTSTGKSKQQLISKISDDEKIRNKAENELHFKIAKKIINSALTIFGKGDSLKGWFVKNLLILFWYNFSFETLVYI